MFEEYFETMLAIKIFFSENQFQNLVFLYKNCYKNINNSISLNSWFALKEFCFLKGLLSRFN